MRQSLKIWSMLISLVILAAPALAQPTVNVTTPSTAAAMPKLEGVSQYIPSDSLAYAVVNNVAAMTSDVDKYLEDVGLAALLKPMMPTGLLDLIKLQAMLGDGFNPNGGFAFVMLDPNKFGIDVIAMMESKKAATKSASAPATAPAAEPKLPFAIFVPGNGVKEVFGNYPQTPAGKYTEVQLRMGKMLAGQIGGYVVLSPLAEVLDALSGAKGGPALPKAQADIIAQSDLAIHVNMASADPIIKALMAKAEGEMTHKKHRRTKGPEDMLKMYMDMYGQVLSQMDGITLAGRFVPTGLVLDGLVDFKPDSALGRHVAAQQPQANLLSKVPDHSYILAVGSVETCTAESKQFQTDMMNKMMSALKSTGMPETVFTGLADLTSALSDQVTGAQLVVGGAPDGNGIFAASYVLSCKDSNAVRSIFEEKVPKMVDSIVQAVMATTNPAAATQPADANVPVKLTYTRAAEKAGDLPVDVMEIVVADMPEDTVTTVSKLLGEEKLRIFLVPVDNNTIVLTFGGSLPFVNEAVKAAKEGSGKILQSEGAVETLKYLPPNLCEVMLLNLSNLTELINKATQVVGGEGAGLPFQITCKTPLAIGSGVEGSSVHMAIYVPNNLVKEVVAIIQSMTGGFGGRPTTGPATKESGF